MHEKKLLLTVCLLSIILLNAYGIIWGFKKAKNEADKGLILPLSTEGYFFILFPKQELPVYDISKKQLGTLFAEENRSENEISGYIYLLLNGETKQISVEDEDMQQIGYEIYALKYYDVQGDFLKVLKSRGEYYINIKDLEKNGFINLSWLNYFNQDRRVYYAKEPGLHLREYPGTEAAISGFAEGNLTEIELTGEITGNWAKVKITRHKKDRFYTDITPEENIEYVKEGWMKVIDDSGEPNLYYHPRGA